MNYEILLPLPPFGVAKASAEEVVMVVLGVVIMEMGGVGSGSHRKRWFW